MEERIDVCARSMADEPWGLYFATPIGWQLLTAYRTEEGATTALALARQTHLSWDWCVGRRLPS